MERQIPRQYWTCTREIGQPCYLSIDGRVRMFCSRKSSERCYRSTDGRFQVRDTWSIDKVREPNWLLVDFFTGHCYRFFVRMQAEQKMAGLLAQADSVGVGIRQHD
ncbi:MAG: hypothetical protein WBM52_12750 [Thiogranum sp.]